MQLRAFVFPLSSLFLVALPSAQTAGGLCLPKIKNQTGSPPCFLASANPTMGYLYPQTIDLNVEVDELRSVMLKDHIRYMPVTEGDALVGVLSFHDVARAVLEEQAFENRMLKGYIKDSPT